MKAYRTFRFAVKSLRRNPLRAMLTTLGIVIGVAAVIAMMEIGEGSSSAIRQSIAGMGANVLTIFPGSATSGGIFFGSGSTTTLTPKDCEAIAQECPAVLYAVPLVRSRTQVVYGSRNWVPNTMYGSTPDYLPVQNWSIAKGAAFTDRDVTNANRVCLLGQTLVKELFQGEDPVGEEIRIKGISFRVVGTLNGKGSNMVGMDQDDMVLVPWTTLKYRVTSSAMASTNQSTSSTSSSSSSTTTVNTISNIYPGSQASLYPEASSTQKTNNPMVVRFANVDNIMVSARSTEEINPAIEQITALLRQRHHVQPERPDDFTIRDMTQMLTTLTATTTMMTNLLLAVAMISLIVGGVGIMNIMLVSVTERTREIGLRMAVGARAKDILRQFILEAVVLCLVGGALGILLGHGGSLVVKMVLSWPVETSPEAIVAAVLVSAAIGIVFGFYPAWKASRLDPIHALRYE